MQSSVHVLAAMQDPFGPKLHAFNAHLAVFALIISHMRVLQPLCCLWLRLMQIMQASKSHHIVSAHVLCSRGVRSRIEALCDCLYARRPHLQKGLEV